MNTTEVCGQTVKTLFGPKPCVRSVLHLGGCNPFSNTAPKLDPHGVIRAAKNEVQQPTVQPRNDPVQNLPPVPAAQVQVDERPLPGETACIWSGTGGRCIKRLGHSGPHQEMIPDAFS